MLPTALYGTVDYLTKAQGATNFDSFNEVVHRKSLHTLNTAIIFQSLIEVY